MQSTLDQKVIAFHRPSCLRAERSEMAKRAERVATLPRALLHDAWWVIPALPAPKRRAQLVLVPGCGRAVKP